MSAIRPDMFISLDIIPISNSKAENYLIYKTTGMSTSSGLRLMWIALYIRLWNCGLPALELRPNTTNDVLGVVGCAGNPVQHTSDGSKAIESQITKEQAPKRQTVRPFLSDRLTGRIRGIYIAFPGTRLANNYATNGNLYDHIEE
jgi:hypothetical protein